jgi:hypothetical protein
MMEAKFDTIKWGAGTKDHRSYHNKRRYAERKALKAKTGALKVNKLCCEIMERDYDITTLKVHSCRDLRINRTNHYY